MYVLFQWELELSKLPGMREVDVAPKSYRKRHSMRTEDDESLLGVACVGTTEHIYTLTAAVIALFTPYAHITLK